MERILFVSHEMSYTGAPRSLLRMCKVAKRLGYDISVWSAAPGPFEAEFQKNNISVRIMPPEAVFSHDAISEIKRFDMAICNTIVTDEYVRSCSRYIPTAWFIREGSNISDFIIGDGNRRQLLRNFRNIICVSDYAADELRKYTSQKIHILRNCIEDEADKAAPYIPGTGEKVSFILLGTIISRKGIDILLEAFEMMPERYQQQSELFFAGESSNYEPELFELLLNKTYELQNVFYLGQLTGDDVFRIISEKDVVVVASRDESCSLVILEGAMLSKPLIATENVGAKYMIKADNGLIVKTESVESLRDAMMQMIDRKGDLAQMGLRSRVYYEEMASMESYTRNMSKLFMLCNKKNSVLFMFERARNRILTSSKLMMLQDKAEGQNRRKI